MQTRITDRLIASLPKTEKTYEVVDTALKGFCLIVRPSGVISFCLRYRNAQGVKKSYTLGKFGVLTVATARKLAEQRAAEVRMGNDIQADRQAIRSEADRLALRLTVRRLFEQWAEVELSRHKDGGKEARRMVTQHVLPTIGDLPVEDIQKSHIANVLDPMLARGTSRMANVILGKMRQMFRFAVERDLIEANPTAIFRKSKVGGKDVERTRVLSESEVKALTHQLTTTSLDEKYQIAIWLQLATCCRVGELLAAKWSQVDLDTGTWQIPSIRSKNKEPHVVYLSTFALTQFKNLKEITGEETWCYPGTKKKGAAKSTSPVDSKTVTRQVNDRQLPEDREPLSKRTPETDALILAGGKWTPHDLRRTGATMMTMLGVLPEVAERCLNHEEQNRVKRIYQRYSYVPEMREAWRRLGEHLELLTTTKTAP